MRLLIAAIVLLAAGTSAAAGAEPAGLKEGLAAYRAGDFDRAAAVLMDAAEAGEPAAQYNLGRLYFAGQGVPQDAAAALHWYLRAAEQGYAAAQYQVGVWHESGWVVPVDGRQAAEWYRRAARQGHSGAMINLGFLYAMGRLIERDRVEAYMWFERVAAPRRAGGRPGRGGGATGLAAGRKARDWLVCVMPEAEFAEAQRRAPDWQP